MRNVNALVSMLLVLLVAGSLAACGSSDDTTTSEPEEVVSGDLAPVAGAGSAYNDLAGEAELRRGGGGTIVSISASGLRPKTAYIAHLHTGGCDQSDPGGPHFQFEPGGSEEPPNEIHLEFTSGASGEGKAQARSKRQVPLGEAGSIVLHVDESHHEMTTFDPAAAEAVSTVFVHNGTDHSKEGGRPEVEPEPPHSDKIACAELEGPSTAAGGGAADDGAASAGGDMPTIVIRDGEPVDGVEEIAVSAGEDVRFRVSSDQAEEVHVHGYDIAQDVPADGTTEFDFPADLEGIYEVELEKLGVQIAELRVEP